MDFKKKAKDLSRVMQLQWFLRSEPETYDATIAVLAFNLEEIYTAGLKEGRKQVKEGKGMRFFIMTLGGGIIGILTSVMGYPTYDFVAQTFVTKNVILLAGLCVLWCLFIGAVPRCKDV